MKKQINLYQPSCYPKREKASFSQFLIFVFMCISISLFGYYFIVQQTNALNQQLSDQKNLVTQQQLMLSELVVALQKNRAPEDALRLHGELQDEVKAKQRLLARLSGINLQDSVSFSELMRGLSYANMPDLTINHFSMIGSNLNISGEAKQSDSVPIWLSNIQQTKELSSVAFKALSITENKGIFSFQLSNNDVKGKANE